LYLWSINRLRWILWGWVVCVGLYILLVSSRSNSEKNSITIKLKLEYYI